MNDAKLSEVKIIPATDAHSDEIWQIFHEVVAAGDTYVFDPTTTRDQALSYWLSPEAHTFVALDGSQVCGTYILKQNQPGLGLACGQRQLHGGLERTRSRHRFFDVRTLA